MRTINADNSASVSPAALTESHAGFTASHSRTGSGADGCDSSEWTPCGMTIRPRISGSRSANPITTKYRSGEVFETAAISAVAGLRIASQRLRLAGKAPWFIVAGIGMAGQKIFGFYTAKPEDFANLLLSQTVFPVAFRGDGFERETLRVSVFGARQSPSDFIRDFERQNHVFRLPRSR